MTEGNDVDRNNGILKIKLFGSETKNIGIYKDGAVNQYNKDRYDRKTAGRIIVLKRYHLFSGHREVNRPGSSVALVVAGSDFKLMLAAFKRAFYFITEAAAIDIIFRGHPGIINFH